MYSVFLSVKGDETLVFRGSFMEVNDYEDHLREEIARLDPEGDKLDCYVISDERLQKRVDAIEKWNSLSQEEKEDLVTVNGRKYIRSIYDVMHQIKNM